MPHRDFYIDRLRSAMTVLVVLHHTALTYGAIGGWFWREIPPSRSFSSQLLIFFCTVNQAYFMGFFFFLAGYFTPISLDHKGYGAFVRDRFIRLGLPILAFGFLLGPLTAAMVSASRGRAFWSTFVRLWQHKEFIVGPLWFAEVLLIFTLVYVLVRRIRGPQPDPEAPQPTQTSTPVPGWIAWLLAAAAVGAAAFAIRQILPIGKFLYGYWALYIFLFPLGIRARRCNWLAQLTWRDGLPWMIVACLVLPAMPIAVLLTPPGTEFGTGLNWPTILYAMWEPFVAWGIIALWLLWFRARMNRPSPFWDWLNRRAYAVYIVHPLVLVGISLLLHGWVAPALVKFGAVGALACAGSWLLADPLVRMPGVRRVV